MNFQDVAVIGAGPLGRRLAALISGAGFNTVLEDILPSNLRKAADYLTGDDPQDQVHRGNLRFASSVEDAVRTADLIVDCVPDELESKLEIFSLLDRMAPPLAIFVTPTQSLSIADLASCTYRADRCIAVQFDSERFAYRRGGDPGLDKPDFVRGAGRGGEVLDGPGFQYPIEARSR